MIPRHLFALKPLELFSGSVNNLTTSFLSSALFSRERCLPPVKVNETIKRFTSKDATVSPWPKTVQDLVTPKVIRREPFIKNLFIGKFDMVCIRS